MKAETTRPARSNLLQQQERFDDFRDEFNSERPHEAIGMRCPDQLYKASPRKMPKVLPAPSYPEHDDVIAVSGIGNVNFRRRSTYISQALAYQYLGVREEPDGRWLVSFLDLNIGYISRTGFNPL